ncbi:MAG: hypothetical protein ACOY37_13870 [Pseudomonadota bacterium]
MQTFVLHGLIAPPPSAGLSATFGRRSPRRYGWRDAAASPAPAAQADAPAMAEPPCWVDQDFEEAAFE